MMPKIMSTPGDCAKPIVRSSSPHVAVPPSSLSPIT